MTIPKHLDFAIVGAGIIGLATALRLQLDGYAVCLLDQNEPASGCSAGNAGYLSVGNCFPIASPDVLSQLPAMLLQRSGPLVIRPSCLPRIMPWATRLFAATRPARYAAATRALANLTVRAMASYARLLEAANARHLIQTRGGLHVYRSSRAFEQRVRGLNAYAAFGIEATPLRDGEVRELEPALHGAIAGGVFFPASAACLDPRELGVRFAERIVRGGGQLHRNRVTALIADTQGWTVKTAAQPMRARNVVVTAGRWSDALLQPLGYRVPLEAERGYHLMLPSPGHTLNRPVVVAEHHFVMTSMNQGLRLAGTVEFAPLDAPMDPRRADMLLRQAAPFLPGLSASGATRWMGSRPTLPDSVPAIGRAARHPGLFYSFGHQHCGLTLAAISADLLADVIARRSPVVDSAAYDLSRFE